MVVPFIAVEGPIGVGKTSLSRAIASARSFEQLSEIVSENPFLDQFYEDKERWSFQTEMFFLCNRYEQLKRLRTDYIDQGKPVVADYHIFKNILFAQRTLEPSDFQKYKEIYQILTRDLPLPNIIVYLHASLETLQKRIDLRGRTFEQHMDPHYLSQLSADYEQFLQDFARKHPEIPILTFDGDQLDFVNNKQDLEHILQRVDDVLTKGAYRL